MKGKPETEETVKGWMGALRGRRNRVVLDGFGRRRDVLWASRSEYDFKAVEQEKETNMDVETERVA